MTDGMKWNRKVQLLHNTRYLALPLTWCEMNDINKQAIMQITLEPDGSLRILPEVPDDQ